ncbi:MAG TPA: RsmB/NOP family class I SAM-dependent RNA methyltransferase [Bacteroidota bacterium]|nr:RsmB/NOP family class I SAM-dependent RNA methyltransferase [Bacteroidota bacterium]
MKLSSLIGHTIEISIEIDKDTRPADTLIDAYFRAHKYLGSHDRRFIAETVYGMLRWKLTLDFIVERAASPVSIKGTDFFSSNLVTYRCIAYLMHVKKEPPGALIAEFPTEAAPAIESIARHCNDVRYEENPVRSLSLIESFPEWMVSNWIGQFGGAEAARLCASLNRNAPVTLRVNTIKATVDECRAALGREGIEAEPTKLSPFGLNLKKRINVFQLEAFRNGFFEVQDEGSQLLALLVDPKPSAKVVDACAGAGGKTLALGAVMKNRGVIYALDPHTGRLDELRKRLKRSGADTVRVRTADGATLPDDLVGIADNVLVDAPCSGLGTIRRNPGMKWSVTPETVNEISEKQKRIIELYSGCVKPGGVLVYATCTTMPEENEQVVESFLEAHPEFELESPAARLSRYGLASLGENKYFQLLPHRHDTDGFFGAVMKKKWTV